MYVTPQEVREVAVQITATSQPTAWTDEVLRKVIERASRIFDKECGVEDGYFEAAYYPVWEAGHNYLVGDIVTPTMRNGHIYRVTKEGTSGSTEPTFPTTSGATVTSGTVIITTEGPDIGPVEFTEAGADVAPTPKTVYGDGTNLLSLPPYVPGTLDTTLIVPEGYTAQEFIESDSYLIRSLNGVINSFNPTFGGGWYANVPITVTAVWGFPETPADVQHAIIEFVINLVKEVDPASIKMMSLEGMPLRERMPPRVKLVAEKYKFTGAVLV
jgi:hypothetical protein